MALHFARRIPGITVYNHDDGRGDVVAAYAVEPGRVYLWDRTTDAMFIGVARGSDVLVVTVTKRGQHAKVFSRSRIRKGVTLCRTR